MIGVKQGGLALTLPVIIAALAIGGGVILTTGLLCGLVARPNNCIDRPTTASTARPATTPMATVSTTTPGTGTTPAAATTTPIAATSSTPAGATTSTPSIVVTTSAAGATTTPLPATSTSTPLPATSTSTRLPATSTSTPLPATSPIVTTDRVTSTPLVTGSVTARETTPGFTLPPLTTASTINPRTTPATLVEFRLPTALAPNKYDLLLRVDHDPYSSQAETDSPKSLGYTGEVSIEFRAVEATSQIVLHMDQAITLTDQNVAVTSNGVPIGVANKAYDNFQIYRINLTAPLALNSVNTLALKFRSRTTKDGFYFHGYQESSQRERSSLGTRFVPNYARTAFPCFDEPGFKAQFSLVIEHPRTSIALSNYPVLTQVDFNDADRAKTRTTFQTTQPISTYSLGWAVVPADFGKKTIANVPGLGIDISIYGRASELDLGFGDFALEVAQKTLVYLRNKLGTPNALPPKVDLIALPYFPDFSSPSWGLNGFKEYDLFYTDGENSKFDRQLTALTVAKEMAHNWFGDYLTCEFWDDVWIQEGLAQYYQYLAVNDAYPEWDIIDQFLIENTVPVMWRDGYESAVPLKFLIYETVQFKYLFTDLLYKKSAALMRMFSTAYGVADFETSVNNFLASTAYGTYNFENFANLFPMSTNLGMPAKDYLEPWVVQRNLPQITLIKDDSGASTRVTFIQERFLLVILDLETDITTEYRWPIHIECKAGGSIDDPLAGSVTEFKYLLTGASGSVTLPGKFNWVKCNKDFTGYYITDYGDSQFAAFETVLLNARDTFSVADRVNLVHTAFELAWLGTHSYGPPSLITIYMTFNEQNLCPWRTLFYHIDRLALLTEHRESFRNLRAFVMQEIVDAIDNLGLNLYEDSANHIEELLKIEFANQLGRLQNVQALNTFTTLFKNISGSYFVDPNNNQLPLSSNLRSLTYKYHMQNTYDINDWFELYSFFFITNEAREKEYALEAIANTRQTFLYDLILDDLLFDPNDRVPIEAAPILFASMGANPTARYFAWYYIREYWGDLFLKGADMRKLSDSMLIITSSFDSLLLVDEAASFFLTSYDFEATDTRLRMLETGLNNYIWVLDREADFELYFFELTK